MVAAKLKALDPKFKYVPLRRLVDALEQQRNNRKNQEPDYLHSMEYVPDDINAANNAAHLELEETNSNFIRYITFGSGCPFGSVLSDIVTRRA